MTRKQDPLKSYHERRDFDLTPEPIGTLLKKSPKSPIFVIQQHAASHLHYDLRLEIDGVLKSWAMPKGPTANYMQKRLAILTEDHPLSYAYFEGIIPKGNYGAGSVMVWDIGNYKNLKRQNNHMVSMNEAFEKGVIEIFLHGKKLEGGYALIRMHDNQWLLIKMHDDFATKHTIFNEKSAISGRSMNQIITDNKDEH